MSTIQVANITGQPTSNLGIVNTTSLGVSGATTLTGAATFSNTVTVTGNATFSNTVTFASDIVPATSYKRNRIINGNMVINQRAATITSGAYCTDRWLISNITTGAWTCAQSSTAPTGFTNSLLFTKTTGGTPSAGDANYIVQFIEGLNVNDLAWGTASAKTVTLSFWVYAGATGTFSGSLRNGGATRSYPFTYTISSANTWTYNTITISGDTTGTWATDTTAGIGVFFDIGSGTTFRATAGAWTTGNYIAATGATTYPSSTSGGTFYITGVQLEVGTKATPYEFVTYSDQLAQCQRYYETQDWSQNAFRIAVVFTSNDYINMYQAFVVPKRTTAGVTWSGNGSGRWVSSAGISSSVTVDTRFYATATGCSVSSTGLYATASYGWLDTLGTMKISAEL